MPEALPIIASIVGIGSGVKNLVGGSQQGGSRSSNTYVPTGLGGADQSFQQMLQQVMQTLQGAGGELGPQLKAAYEGMLNSPVQGQANQAGSFLQNLGQGVGGAGQQLWQTALDQQNQLRNTLQQQVTDASRASTSARGLGMGPEGAGLEDKAVSDFLMNWQDRQLGRQATGLQGYVGAANEAGRDTLGGLGATQTGAQWPMQAANSYIGNLGGMNQQWGALMSQIIPYLNQGLGATGQSFTQGQAGLGNIMQGAGNLASYFGPGTNAPAGYGYGTNYGQDNTSLGPPNPWGTSGGGGSPYMPYGGGP